MKIALVSACAAPRVAELSAALACAGHQVSLYIRRTQPRVAEKVETPQGYSLFHVPAGPAGPVPESELLTSMGAFADYLNGSWAGDLPDVAHAHCWMSGIASQLAARHLGLAVVQTFQGLGVVPRELLQMEATVARSADWVAAASSDEVLKLTRMGRPRARISVVPLGVDTTRFKPDGDAVPKGARYRIISSGEVLVYSVFEDIVRAMPMIPHAELLITGGPEGPELDADPQACALRELAAGLGVARRVHLYGSLDRADAPALLRSADVVACNPWYEPSDSAAIDAMACGVPVVAATVGAMPDTVVHDVTGRLVPPKDPRSLADAINTLLRDSFLRRSFGAAGRDRVRARYSWDRIAVDTLRIYRSVSRARNPLASTPA